MKQEVLDNAKIIALKEEVKNAIINNELDSKISVLRMKALDYGMSVEDFDALVEHQKESVKELKNSTNIVNKHKHLIWIGALLLIIIEWILIFDAHPEAGKSHHIILTLVVNFITLIVFSIGLAAYIRKKK